jgi:hypothetical protein
LLLQIEPELGAYAKPVVSQSKRGIGGDGAPAIEDTRDAIGRNFEIARQFGGRESELRSSSCRISPGCIGVRRFGRFMVVQLG